MLVLKDVLRPTYTFGFRFEINSQPSAALDLTIHGGTTKNCYTIQIEPDNPAESDRIEELRFRSFANTVNLALIINLGNN
ncbi:MAG: hypothetical protein ACI8ZM_005026 [Crocinitomix sp.]|jgi:hypothetical protein